MPEASGAQLDDLLAREDWDAIERLCERHAFRIALEAPEFWPRVFSTAPENWVRARPRVRHLRAVLHDVGADGGVLDLDSMDEYAGWVAAQERPAVHDRLAELLGRMQRLLALGRFDEAGAIADRMDASIREADEFAGFEDLLPAVLIRMGTARLAAGRLEEAVSTFMTAVRWSLVGRPHPAERHARNFLAIAYVLRGDVNRARVEAAAHDIAPMARPGTVGHALEGDTQYLPALIALADLDREGVESALTRIRPARNAVLWWIDSAVRARFDLIWGDSEAAARRLELDLLAHRDLCTPGTMARAMLHGALADLRFAAGDLDGAWSALDETAGGPAGPWLDATRHRLSGSVRATPSGSGARASHHVINAVLSDRRSAIGDRERHLELARRAIELGGDASAIIEASADLGHRLAASLSLRMPAHRFLGDRQHGERLTARELEIVRALRRHTTIRAIAAELFLSTNTVKTHLRNAYRKLGVSTRSGALSAVDRMSLDGQARPSDDGTELGAASTAR